jgi:hypothetical protein
MLPSATYLDHLRSNEIRSTLKKKNYNEPYTGREERRKGKSKII